MDKKLIEQINKDLEKAVIDTNKLYSDLGLEKKFNQWFKDLDRETKLEIYRLYQLEKIDFGL